MEYQEYQLRETAAKLLEEEKANVVIGYGLSKTFRWPSGISASGPRGDRQQRRAITAPQKAEGVGHPANRHDMPTMAMWDSTVPYYIKKRTGKWRRERDSNPRYGN